MITKLGLHQPRRVSRPARFRRPRRSSAPAKAAWRSRQVPGADAAGRRNQRRRRRPCTRPSSRSILEHLGVHPAKGTRLVDVAFESVDPALAASVVDTLSRRSTSSTISRPSGTRLKRLRAGCSSSSRRCRLLSRPAKANWPTTRRDTRFYSSKSARTLPPKSSPNLRVRSPSAEAERIQEQSRAMLVQDAMPSAEMSCPAV